VVILSDTLFQRTAMPEPPVTIFMPPKNPFVNRSPAAPVRSDTPVSSAASGTVTSSPLQSEPEKRWASDREIKASDPWQQSPEKVVMKKDADGTARVPAHRRQRPRAGCRRPAAARSGGGNSRRPLYARTRPHLGHASIRPRRERLP
jgi:hypothetical protein